jgi:hypothetical protein
MSDHEAPRPSEPEDVGVEERDTAPMELEPAKLLANEARDRLRDRGFDDEAIDEWAKAYVDRFGSGDTDTFIEWVAEEQRR